MIDIKNKVECCGCSACKEICPKQCIEMLVDEEGFLYPNIDKELCVACNLCERVCPIINCIKEKKVEQRAFLAKHEDAKVRVESTSGGAFTSLAKFVLDKKGVVFGAGFDDDFNVKHMYVENEADLAIFRNSKYVQSNIDGSYGKVKEFLEQDRWVCFSGTPCQVEGLYHFLQKSYERLLLVDITCHAVPSPLVWNKYKEYCKPTTDAKLIEAKFRSKEKYGYQYSQMCMKYDNGYNRYSGVESDPYLRAFFSDLSDRPSCYDCIFKKRYRVSDVTIWDCFDVYRIDKQFDDNQGVTRILAHTEKGATISSKLENCTVVEISPEVAVEGVKELTHSVELNPNRKEFFEDFLRMETKEVFEKWFPDTIKVRIERVGRYACERMGIYRIVKRIARKMLGKE